MKDNVIKGFEQYLHTGSHLGKFGIIRAESIEECVNHEYFLVLGHADLGGYVVPDDSICCLKASLVAKGRNYVAGIADLFLPDFSQKESSFILRKQHKQIHYDIRSKTLKEERVYLIPYQK